MGKHRRKLGLAFPDELLKVRDQAGHFKKKLEDGSWEDNLIPNYQPEIFSDTISIWRLITLASIFLIVFFGLFLKLFHLQVVEGKLNRDRADLNRIQVRMLHAPRGVIYDRNGTILAQNSPGFRLGEKFLTRDEARILEARNDPQINDLEIDNFRFYPFGPITAHILGYVGQISQDELKQNFTAYEQSSTAYNLGDRIGRAGIEAFYENWLRGKDGAEIIEIDSSGRKLRTLRKIDPISGKNVHLSLDIDLQKEVFRIFSEGVVKAGSCCGAAIIEDPSTGEILALVSLPSYDNNCFTDPQRGDEATNYFQDPTSPLLNRVIAGTYPPGSTFKITTALAGISTGKITKSTQFEDTGVMFLGPWQFPNWYFIQYGRKEGMVDLVKALQRSNDIFFYKVGELVGEKTLAQVAKKIGLGKKLGIDLPGEVDGLVPSDEWKQKNIGQGWYPGDTLHMAIGQGFILTTPLQILAQTAFAANGGSLIQPHLATKITNSDGVVIKQFNFDPIVKDIFKKEDLELVKKGLSLVPKDGGTAWPFFNFSLPTAGKTGTAEYGDPKGRTHAWYTSFAPLDNPKIAVTVLIEGGGEGSTVASPVVKQIYTWYFNPDKSNLKSLELYQASDSARILGE